jgi:ABC-type nitrate/sulfonate/bicarbonate transport system substrate-binding protein
VRLSSWLRKGSGVAAALTAVVGLAACGSSSSGGGSTSGDQTLTVAVPFPLTNYSDVLAAQAEGYFKHFGVNVKILQNSGADSLNELVGNQTDLVVYASTAAMTLAIKGEKVSAVQGFALEPGELLVGGPKITSVAQLKALHSCRIATPAVGTPDYGFAQIYIKKFGLHCDTDPAALLGTELARVASGADNAVVATFPAAISAVKGFKAHILVNPQNASQRAKYGLPKPYLTGVIFGLPRVLKSKRHAVVDFLKGLNEANRLLVPSEAARVGKDDETFTMFKGSSSSLLATELKSVLPSIGKAAVTATPPPGASASMKAEPQYQPGFITKAGWDTALQQFVPFGVEGFNPNLPAVQYNQMVDMSYMNAALGH